MINFDDSDIIVQKFVASRIIDSLKSALQKVSKDCEKAVAETFLLEQNLSNSTDVKQIAELSKELKLKHGNLVHKLAIRNRISNLLIRNQERVAYFSEKLNLAGIYDESVDKKKVKDFVDQNKSDISEDSINLNMLKKDGLICRFILGELLYFDGINLDCSHPLNKPVIMACGYDFLCKIVSLFPKCVSTISDDMFLNVRFKQNILKAITAYVSEEVKSKSIRDINKELGGLLSFKSEITENVPDYIAGVQNSFDVAGKHEALRQFPEKAEEINSKLKCNEKSELLPPSKKVPVLASGVAGEVQKTEEQESEEIRISQEKEMEQMEAINMIEMLLGISEEETESLEESLKADEDERSQKLAEEKNEKKEAEKQAEKAEDELEKELETMMARSLTKHDD